MAQDWKKLQAQFQHDHAKYGTGAKEWCEAKGLNYATARRYIKVRKLAQSDSAQSKSAQSAQKLTAQKVSAEKKSLTQKSHMSPITSDDGKHKSASGERDEKGRFAPCNSLSVGNPGNPSPSNPATAGNQRARKSGLYAKYFPSEKQHMFDAADTATLEDELQLTRARLQSGIEYLGKIHEDMAQAETVEDRISLYESFTRVNAQLDVLTGRIESLTRTMSTLGIDIVKLDKIRAEVDKLRNEGAVDDTPVSQMLEDIQNMGSGGLMRR
ncbi:hypothetical protein [Grimontia marina]|uniref:Terminase small subunit n=1 Tax=Grimontia marina TaxID=646534 RepID=A0A128EYS8_9GAMM|nr:hypothetical protein [Grimontia marina]CZF79708.1 hypothetical protein GMA8713_01096 [Grimontia marina]